MTTIAILGLGEAGRLYATGLRDAGAVVRGYDPSIDISGAGVPQAASVAEAVDGADVVLSLVGAPAAEEAARDALAAARGETVFADLNTAAPEVKRRIAAEARERRVPMADVAVLAPVPRAGHRTRLVASGDGAQRFAEHVTPLGVPVEVVAGEAGEAARLKLLRTVFMKGLATLILESVGAARAAGAEEWMREQLAHELGPGGRDLVERLIDGTYRHAVRREIEVRDALEELERLGAADDMTRATLAWFERIVAERDADSADG